MCDTVIPMIFIVVFEPSLCDLVIASAEKVKLVTAAERKCSNLIAIKTKVGCFYS